MSLSHAVQDWRRSPDGAARDLRYREWLYAEGSLTARIRSRCRRFSMTVVRHELARPERNALSLLDIPQNRNAWVREVVLQADGIPVVYARSVLPRASLRGAWRLFAGIGGRPLGHALFADPLITRSPLTSRRIDARNPLWQAATRHAAANCTELWARRALFFRGGQPLLVTEVFLPAILELR